MTFLLCDFGWYVHKRDVQNKRNDNTHTNIHMAMVADKKPPASTPYLAQRRDGALSLTIGYSTRPWLDPFAKVKSSLLLKIHGPSDRELANKTAD